MPISEAESHVMEVLWREAPRSAEDISLALQPLQGWTLGTVKTLLSRLVKKGAAAAEPDGRRFLYRPLIERHDYVLAESTGLLDRLFGGRIAPLVAHFSERQRLSDEDMKQLKRLVDEWDHGR
jgi:predicted transcriptional regulator